MSSTRYFMGGFSGLVGNVERRIPSARESLSRLARSRATPPKRVSSRAKGLDGEARSGISTFLWVTTEGAGDF